MKDFHLCIRQLESPRCEGTDHRGSAEEDQEAGVRLGEKTGTQICEGLPWKGLSNNLIDIEHY